MNESSALRSWRKLSGTALGRRLYSRLLCRQAPYFRSIRPLFEVLEPGRAVAGFRKRRRVTNHIGTVHAIAMANLCELVAGLVTEVSLPRSMRWIPRGMDIQYLARAESDVTAEATVPVLEAGAARDLAVPVRVTDRQGQDVVKATITMYLSPKR
jgi:acyl-coenzyme A thioesterase PaaI-like protein